MTVFFLQNLKMFNFVNIKQQRWFDTPYPLNAPLTQFVCH